MHLIREVDCIILELVHVLVFTPDETRSAVSLDVEEGRQIHLGDWLTHIDVGSNLGVEHWHAQLQELGNQALLSSA